MKCNVNRGQKLEKGSRSSVTIDRSSEGEECDIIICSYRKRDTVTILAPLCLRDIIRSPKQIVCVQNCASKHMFAKGLLLEKIHQVCCLHFFLCKSCIILKECQRYEILPSKTKPRVHVTSDSLEAKNKGKTKQRKERMRNSKPEHMRNSKPVSTDLPTLNGGNPKRGQPSRRKSSML